MRNVGRSALAILACRNIMATETPNITQQTSRTWVKVYLQLEDACHWKVKSRAKMEEESQKQLSPPGPQPLSVCGMSEPCIRPGF
ncbi:hypothetical protein DPMN_002425 [Dreissena polymorpha]|uniref:Uncharacterized protein n=1 Tax=Dreissena polymorpha TaxID=45954 RepID=A0A9D4MMT5_DREPO|nr:hypothetical protein DPMN_002425 [Dreissena polymorpha]